MSALLRFHSVFKRQPASFFNNSAALAIRGPKKKGKSDKIELPENPDIVNIFKDGKDAPVYPSDMYPPFVMELLNEPYTPDEIMLQMYRGERMPTAKEQWTLCNAVFRQGIQDRNLLVKQRYEYESEDDMGEDLGGGIDEDLEIEQSQGGEVAKE